MKISKLIFLCLIIFFCSCNKDKSAWESAQGNNTVASYKDYINKFPDGDYKNKADSCIQILVWNEVKSKNTIEGYKEFIATYSGAYQLQQAKENIEKLKNLNIPFVTDIDGNRYHTITIGNQIWMVENLKTTRYRNGESISNVTYNDAWYNCTSGAWCDYDNSAANGTKYGHLYNGYAVFDIRNIAPKGWHVATDAEWTTLIDYVSANTGNSRSAAKALASTTNWETDANTNTIGNNLSINNSSGFSSLSGGGRINGGAFDYAGRCGNWWTATEDNALCAWLRDLSYDRSDVGRHTINKLAGLSVRCLKGEDTITTTEKNVTNNQENISNNDEQVEIKAKYILKSFTKYTAYAENDENIYEIEISHAEMDEANSQGKLILSGKLSHYIKYKSSNKTPMGQVISMATGDAQIVASEKVTFYCSKSELAKDWSILDCEGYFSYTKIKVNIDWSKTIMHTRLIVSGKDYALKLR